MRSISSVIFILKVQNPVITVTNLRAVVPELYPRRSGETIWSKNSLYVYLIRILH